MENGKWKMENGKWWYVVLKKVDKISSYASWFKVRSSGSPKCPMKLDHKGP
jgi:hypothetical protein